MSRAGPPVLRVVRGSATEEELAALVTVLAARARRGAGAVPGMQRLDAWSDPAALLAVPPRPGPGAWRASALPR